MGKSCHNNKIKRNIKTLSFAQSARTPVENKICSLKSGLADYLEERQQKRVALQEWQMLTHRCKRARQARWKRLTYVKQLWPPGFE